MRQSFYLLFLIMVAVSCKDSSGIDATQLAATLELKRGTAISCGPAGAQYGSLQFDISMSKEIKDLFTLGVKLLHSFEYEEAEKVFAGIIDKDPASAMAWWGVAMSNFHPLWTPPTEAEFKKGKQALDIALQLANGEKEKGYINALAAYYSEVEGGNHRSRCLKFEKAMAALYEKYPGDKEAAVFYALCLTAAADPADKSYAKQQKAGDILNALYPGQPEHPGIIHYIIHAYDSPELASLGLAAARKYASVAPSSAHALHMPSHIFTRLGLWDEAINANLASVESARCYAQQAGIKGHWDEELHGLDYLMYAYLQKGDNRSAGQQWNYLKTITTVEPVNFKVVYAWAAIPARYVLENKQWEKAAALDIHISNFDWSSYQWQKAILHFTRALGHIHTGNEAGATREVQQLQVIYDALVQQKDDYKARQVLVQLKSATAWLHWLQKKEDALYLLQEAADMEEKTEKHPVTPGEVIPARQLLADMLVQLDSYKEALQAYEMDMQRHPNRFNSVYGAALSAGKTGDITKAKKYYRQLIDIAVRNSQRKEIAEAKQFLRRTP